MLLSTPGAVSTGAVVVVVVPEGEVVCVVTTETLFPATVCVDVELLLPPEAVEVMVDPPAP